MSAVSEHSPEKGCPVFLHNDRPAVVVAEHTERAVAMGGVFQETGRIVLAVSDRPTAETPVVGPCSLSIEDYGSSSRFPVCGNSTCPFKAGSDFRAEVQPKKLVISET